MKQHSLGVPHVGISHTHLLHAAASSSEILLLCSYGVLIRFLDLKTNTLILCNFSVVSHRSLFDEMGGACGTHG